MEIKTCDVCGYETRDWHRIKLSKDGNVAVSTILCGDHADRAVKVIQEYLQDARIASGRTIRRPRPT